jgi:hypothetical protein
MIDGHDHIRCTMRLGGARGKRNHMAWRSMFDFPDYISLLQSPELMGAMVWKDRSQLTLQNIHRFRHVVGNAGHEWDWCIYVVCRECRREPSVARAIGSSRMVRRLAKQRYIHKSIRMRLERSSNVEWKRWAFYGLHARDIYGLLIQKGRGAMQ